jgi:hypothetical protein
MLHLVNINVASYSLQIFMEYVNISTKFRTLVVVGRHSSKWSSVELGTTCG